MVQVPGLGAGGKVSLVGHVSSSCRFVPLGLSSPLAEGDPSQHHCCRDRETQSNAQPVQGR